MILDYQKYIYDSVLVFVLNFLLRCTTKGQNSIKKVASLPTINNIQTIEQFFFLSDNFFPAFPLIHPVLIISQCDVIHIK